MGYLLDLLDSKVSSESVERAEVRHNEINDKNDQTPQSGAFMSSTSFMSCGQTSAKSGSATPIEGEREPIDWLSDYEERAAIREYDGQRPRPDAERLAWGEIQNEWHRLHGKPTPAWQCAGCLEPLSGGKVFVLPDGARAHDSLDCIAAYGKHWRSAATAALVAIGLPRPTKVPEDDS